MPPLFPPVLAALTGGGGGALEWNVHVGWEEEERPGTGPSYAAALPPCAGRTDGGWRRGDAELPLLLLLLLHHIGACRDLLPRPNSAVMMLQQLRKLTICNILSVCPFIFRILIKYFFVGAIILDKLNR
jgi:hypothetical protein